MEVIEHSSEVHTIDLGILKLHEKRKFLLMSDIHLDSKKCDRELFKKHLDYAKEKGAGVLIFGDLMDLMQGKNDRRGSKTSLRKEYLLAPYFDSVIEDVTEFLLPYADEIKLITYGNHETAIIRHNEIDALNSLIFNLNTKKKETDSRIFKGAYNGYVRIRSQRGNKLGNRSQKYIKYHHGAGGNAPVTGGAISQSRAAGMFPDADIVVMGHIHQYNMRVITTEKIAQNFKIKRHDQYHLRTSSYKYHGDWETEKMFPKGALGCWEVEFTQKKKGLEFRCTTLLS